ncbi:MAG: ferredoxin-type protein NapF [Campylobacterota bacterium]
MSSRRELFSAFRGSFQPKEKKEVLIRPPYCVDEDAFAKECASCEGHCAHACQERIIVLGEDNTPRLDFSKSGCTYCDECALACPGEVLQVASKGQIDAHFEIDMLKCLSWNKTMCFSCKDPCLDNAITFLAMFRPSIDQDKCTSCGFCVGVCPAPGAIEITTKEGGENEQRRA